MWVPRPAPPREDPALLTRLLQWTGEQRAPGLRTPVLHTGSNPDGDADGHGGHHYDMIFIHMLQTEVGRENIIPRLVI